MINARNMRRLRFVPRWVVIPHNHRQNVAEHSFHVAWIVLWLGQRLGVTVTPEMMFEALAHDHDEAVSGDIPATSKGAYKGDAGITKCMVKIADVLEAFLFAKEELAFGNTSMVMVVGGLLEAGEVWCERFRALPDAPGKPCFPELATALWAEVDPMLHPNSHPLASALEPVFSAPKLKEEVHA